jgi:localization factor PodJL
MYDEREVEPAPQQHAAPSNDHYHEPAAEQPMATPDFDTALRLAHHAQRLKAIEIEIGNLTKILSSFKNNQRFLLRRQTTISLAVGGICLAATLIAAITIGVTSAPHNAVVTANAAQVEREKERASAAEESIRQLRDELRRRVAAEAPAPAAQPAPVAAPVPVQQVAEAAPTASIAAPAAVATPAPTPRPVAMGRYDEAPKVVVAAAAPAPAVVAPPAPVPTAKPQRVLSSFEKAIAQHLATSSQTVPESWQDMFQREAKGDTRAKLQVAAKFLKGEDVKADPMFAVGLIRQAGKAGNKEAMMWLGYSYAAGNFGKVEPMVAAQWFGDAAKAGVTGAYAELGKLYEKGVDGAPDPEAALAWYQKGAHAGDQAAAQAAQRINRTLLSENVLLSAEPAKPAAPRAADQADGDNEDAAPAAPTPNTSRAQRDDVSGSVASPLAAMPVVAKAPAEPTATAEQQADIRAGQRMLKVLGYKITKPDGELGAETQAAIRAYQKDHAQLVNGQFSAELMDSLTREIRYGQ